uniref:Uncharacterized protein n=1 Tax=Anopheles minimus TaxID=112268 RepID=A0A182WNS5_9DIPT
MSKRGSYWFIPYYRITEIHTLF